jgi:hypothetical protein
MYNNLSSYSETKEGADEFIESNTLLLLSGYEKSFGNFKIDGYVSIIVILSKRIGRIASK